MRYGSNADEVISMSTASPALPWNVIRSKYSPDANWLSPGPSELAPAEAWVRREARRTTARTLSRRREDLGAGRLMANLVVGTARILLPRMARRGECSNVEPQAWADSRLPGSAPDAGYLRPMAVPLSVLDLVPVPPNGTGEDAFANSVQLAQLAEELGYRRYWVAEHHNTQAFAAMATSVLIGMIARETTRIRVGSGGIMLPNHSPLKIAEDFLTLEALFPGRIDLGLGRAPGTDQI